jgi:DNA-binding NtrC family response regulator
MLRSLGHDIVTAGSCREGMDAVRREAFDLVLSDVVLPDGTQGRDFAYEAKALQPGLKVIFMSGYPAHAADPDVLEAAEDLFLRKPFKKAQLAEAINAALEQSARPKDGLRSAS